MNPSIMSATAQKLWCGLVNKMIGLFFFDEETIIFMVAGDVGVACTTTHSGDYSGLVF
jgi:hypothetical protein